MCRAVILAFQGREKTIGPTPIRLLYGLFSPKITRIFEMTMFLSSIVL